MKFCNYLSSKNIFLYCGSGFDFEPLIHLSHIYSNFYFVDNDVSWNNISHIKTKITNKISESYFGKLEIVSMKIGDLQNNSYPNSNYNSTIIKRYSPKLENSLWCNKAFQELNDLANYHILKVKMNRFFGHYKREINVSFIYGEGLTFYNFLLSGQGSNSTSDELLSFSAGANEVYNNNMICTIQTGQLENSANNIMEKYFELLGDNMPQYWLRGYNPLEGKSLQREIDKFPLLYEFDWWTSGESISQINIDDGGYRHTWINILTGIDSVNSKDIKTFEKDGKKLIFDPIMNSRKISEIRKLKANRELDLLLTKRQDILEEDKFFIKNIESIELPYNQLKDERSVILEFSNKDLPSDYLHYLLWLFYCKTALFPDTMRVTCISFINMSGLSENKTKS